MISHEELRETAWRLCWKGAGGEGLSFGLLCSIHLKQICGAWTAPWQAVGSHEPAVSSGTSIPGTCLYDSAQGGC